MYELFKELFTLVNGTRLIITEIIDAMTFGRRVLGEIYQEINDTPTAVADNALHSRDKLKQSLYHALPD